MINPTSTAPLISDQAADEPVTKAMLQQVADKVVICNATGNEDLFLGAVRELLAAVRAFSTAPTTGSVPVATLHDDGYWTWKGTPPHRSNYAGWRMDVYAVPQANTSAGSAPVAVRVCPISDIECGSPRECESVSGKCRKITDAQASNAKFDVDGFIEWVGVESDESGGVSFTSKGWEFFVAALRERLAASPAASMLTDDDIMKVFSQFAPRFIYHEKICLRVARALLQANGATHVF